MAPGSYHQASIHPIGGNGEGAEVESRDNAEIVTSPFQGFEEIGIMVGIGLDDRPICKDNFIVDDVVA